MEKLLYITDLERSLEKSAELPELRMIRLYIFLSMFMEKMA